MNHEGHRENTTAVLCCRRVEALQGSMAVLAVVTSSPPGVEGGHLVIARSLVTAAREQGHDAHLVLTPDCGFGRRRLADIETWQRTDGPARRPVDQVITCGIPVTRSATRATCAG